MCPNSKPEILKVKSAHPVFLPISNVLPSTYNATEKLVQVEADSTGRFSANYFSNSSTFVFSVTMSACSIFCCCTNSVTSFLDSLSTSVASFLSCSQTFLSPLCSCKPVASILFSNWHSLPQFPFFAWIYFSTRFSNCSYQFLIHSSEFLLLLLCGLLFRVKFFPQIGFVF